MVRYIMRDSIIYLTTPKSKTGPPWAVRFAYAYTATGRNVQFDVRTPIKRTLVQAAPRCANFQLSTVNCKLSAWLNARFSLVFSPK
jgi:hypothetical protein